MHCITYGLGDKLYKTKIREVRNQVKDIINKPMGGLWSSPVNTDWGWKDWCLDQKFRIEALASSFEFNFVGKLYTIDTLQDLEDLPHLKEDTPFKDTYTLMDRKYIDFEAVAKEYDGIHLTIAGESRTRLTLPYTLYGWDCESLLVLNRQGIQKI